MLVNANKLKSILLNIYTYSKYYALSFLCHVKTINNKLVFHNYFTSHYFASISFTTKDDEVIYDFVFRVIDIVKLLPDTGYTEFTPLSSTLTLVNLDTTINLSIEDTNIDEFVPPDLLYAPLVVSSLQSSLRKVLRFESISKFLRVKVPVILNENLLQVRFESSIIAVKCDFSFNSTFSVLNIKSMLQFLDSGDVDVTYAHGNILSLRRKNEMICFSLSPVTVTSFESLTGGWISISGYHYAGLTRKLRDIGSIIKKARVEFIFQRHSLVLTTSSQYSSITTIFGNSKDDAILLTFSLPIEIAVILFTCIGDSFFLYRNERIIKFSNNDTTILIPATY